MGYPILKFVLKKKDSAFADSTSMLYWWGTPQPALYISSEKVVAGKGLNWERVNRPRLQGGVLGAFFLGGGGFVSAQWSTFGIHSRPSDQFSSEDASVFLIVLVQLCFIGTCGCGRGGQVPTITTYLHSWGLSYPPSNVQSYALNGTADVDIRKQRRTTPKPVFV